MHSYSYLPILHNGDGNYGYVEGHAEWLKKSAVWGNQDCNVIKP